jgi:hypothetical protein
LVEAPNFGTFASSRTQNPQGKFRDRDYQQRNRRSTPRLDCGAPALDRAR